MVELNILPGIEYRQMGLIRLTKWGSEIRASGIEWFKRLTDKPRFSCYLNNSSPPLLLLLHRELILKLAHLVDQLCLPPNAAAFDTEAAAWSRRGLPGCGTGSTPAASSAPGEYFSIHVTNTFFVATELLK